MSLLYAVQRALYPGYCMIGYSRQCCMQEGSRVVFTYCVTLTLTRKFRNNEMSCCVVAEEPKQYRKFLKSQIKAGIYSTADIEKKSQIVTHRFRLSTKRKQKLQKCISYKLGPTDILYFLANVN